MALRFLLVSLVAGLGVNLPSGDEFSSWASSGREWVQARVDGFRGIESGSDSASEQADTEADLEFAAVVDEMASTFAADLASLERPKPAELLATTTLEVAEDEIVEAETVVDRSEPVAAFEELAIDDGEADESTVSADSARSARSSRIASAVQLTKQAADAWLSVLRNDESGSLGQ
jgi:hypothetical protein